MDMDEGPERARLRLRPNHAFYDTYEVLAPAPAAVTPAPLLKVSGEKPSAVAQGSSSPPSTDAAAAAGTTDDAGGEATVAAVAAVAAVVSPATAVRGDSENEDGVEGMEPPSDGDAVVAAKGGGEAAAGEMTKSQLSTVAGAAAAMESEDSDPMPDIGPSVEGGSSSVAAIAALVKSMSETVGVGKGKTVKSGGALTGVFDLDDTDTSALLELEELNLEDIPEETEQVRVAPEASDGVGGQGCEVYRVGAWTCSSSGVYLIFCKVTMRSEDGNSRFSRCHLTVMHLR